MKDIKRHRANALFTAAVLAAACVVNLLLRHLFDAQAASSLLFVLAVFIIALKTSGYFWGVAASIVGVVLENYAFTPPFFALDFIAPEKLAAAIVMLVVAILTGSLATKTRTQEKIRAEVDREHTRANLLRAVSHDLRTPLTSIYGSTSALMENYDSLPKAQQLKLLAAVQEDAQWLIRMVENLLSVTRIDGQKVTVTKTPTVLEELVDSVLIKFRKRWPDQEVSVTIPEEFISIPMDAMLIEQVLVNLLENAVDHAKGMTELSLTVTQEGKFVRFRVTDNGCGIAPERLKLLFTGFFDRSGSPTDGTRSNMGIGLSVCASIVKAHGSEITAKNRRGGGAEFTFLLETEAENEQQQV